MTATATTSTWQSPTRRPQPRTSRPTTTPRGHSAVSVGQAMPPPPPATAGGNNPSQSNSPSSNIPRSPSPGYFGLAVNDESVAPESNPGQHTRQNWIYSGSSRGSKISPQVQNNDPNSSFEAFRKQSETYGFSLDKNFPGLRRSSGHAVATPSSSHQLPGHASPMSPNSKGFGHFEPGTPLKAGEQNFGDAGLDIEIPRQHSPVSMSPVHRTVADHQYARLSLPTAELQDPSRLTKKQRSDTAPVNDEKGPLMKTPADVASILESENNDTLVLDLRVYPQYTASRVVGALNLCIPTTLLKRPSFTVQKLADTFHSDRDRATFEGWQSCSHIIVYDANSAQPKDAVMPSSILKKFFDLGWQGQGIIVKGGFHAFSKTYPKLVDRKPVRQDEGSSVQPISITATSKHQIPVAGGCAMPATQSAANPFFSNIRQNMDLLDGVGQMPIKIPSNMSERDERALPEWLREAAGTQDEGKQVSDKFLGIERSEQKRMQQALSGEVHYGSPSSEGPAKVQVAGIEKGAKNRYNNIFPYDHSRVKLVDVGYDRCDYVNASHVQAGYSNRKYIATQAPIPATFDDFWKVVWEQDVRVIVMLTAESEGGQVKSHPYWNSGEYGSLKVKKLSERASLLDKTTKTGPARPTLGTRRSTQPHTVLEKKEARDRKSSVTEPPSVTIRHFTLSHSVHPFQPIREITQIQYTQWPDFGAPASPTAILGLIDQVNKYVRSSSSPSTPVGPDESAPADQRPILVHCSAGCGRTGTFCTIDSVIDMLKRQKLERHDEDSMDVDVQDDWVSRDDIDLVAKTVDDFRHQRLSMVQNLRQFVLCYESILQWIVAQEHKAPSHQAGRRGQSFHGSMD